jgi:hypothetical protein
MAREESQSQDRDCAWYLLVAGDCTALNDAAHLALTVDNGPAIIFTLGSTASTRETRCGWIAAPFKVEAAKTELSTDKGDRVGK